MVSFKFTALMAFLASAPVWAATNIGQVTSDIQAITDQTIKVRDALNAYDGGLVSNFAVNRAVKKVRERDPKLLVKPATASKPSQATIARKPWPRITICTPSSARPLMSCLSRHLSSREHA